MTSAVLREIVTPAALPASPISTFLSMYYQISLQILTPFSLRMNTPCPSVLGAVESPKL